jgi:hypothetical protein
VNIRVHPWLLLLCLAFAAPLAAVDGVRIVRLQPGWRDADSFKRISEYFDGKENTGGQVVLRSRPDTRAGYYFFVRIANPGAPTTVKIALAVIVPGSPSVKSFGFATDLATGDTQLNLGLTGADWPDPKANPVAWKLEICAADGHALAAEQSFLWAAPTK